MDAYRNTYRQCNDSVCPAYRFDLPHSHIELDGYTGPTSTEMTRIATVSVDAYGRSSALAAGYRVALDSTTQWYSVPVDSLMQYVGNYITWVETAPTADVCKCVRVEHPEHGGMVRGGDTALDCPAHSKEGLVLGFFEWLKAND